MRWSLKGDLETAWWQADVDLAEQSGAPSVFFLYSRVFSPDVG